MVEVIIVNPMENYNYINIKYVLKYNIGEQECSHSVCVCIKINDKIIDINGLSHEAITAHLISTTATTKMNGSITAVIW